MRKVVATNLVFAIMVFGGYLSYGLASGLPVDNVFLAVNKSHMGRGGGPMIPAWSFVAFLETTVVTVFTIGRAAHWNMMWHRMLCGLIGCLCLGAAVLQTVNLAASFTEGHSTKLGLTTWDLPLALYVWGSHVIYALVGQLHSVNAETKT